MDLREPYAYHEAIRRVFYPKAEHEAERCPGRVRLESASNVGDRCTFRAGHEGACHFPACTCLKCARS